MSYVNYQRESIAILVSLRGLLEATVSHLDDSLNSTVEAEPDGNPSDLSQSQRNWFLKSAAELPS